MIKRIAFMVVLMLVVSGTAMSQQQSKSADQQGQTTKSTQDTKTSKDTTSATQQSDMKVSSDDKSFVKKAAEAGMAEVEMGHVALKQASNEEVKKFAQRMIDDHSKANTELMQLAQSKGITLPASHNMGTGNQNNTAASSDSITPTGQHITGTTAPQAGTQQTGTQQKNDRTATGTTHSDSSKAMKGNDDHKKMDKMSKLSGAEFDREYMKHQVADHDKAVALFERQAKNGKDAELKAFAERTLPTLKEHQQMARDIHAKVGGKMNDSDKASKKDNPDNKNLK
jgi:putative membrane protein